MLIDWSVERLTDLSELEEPQVRQEETEREEEIETLIASTSLNSGVFFSTFPGKHELECETSQRNF